MASVHVGTWRETYRGMTGDAVLDDPALLGRREKFWDAALTDPKYKQNTAAVASHDGTLIGIAMSGPSLDDAGGPQQLYLLYVYAAFHGSGGGCGASECSHRPEFACCALGGRPQPPCTSLLPKEWLCHRWGSENRGRPTGGSNGTHAESGKRRLKGSQTDCRVLAIAAVDFRA